MDESGDVFLVLSSDDSRRPPPPPSGSSSCFSLVSTALRIPSVLSPVTRGSRLGRPSGSGCSTWRSRTDGRGPSTLTGWLHLDELCDLWQDGDGLFPASRTCSVSFGVVAGSSGRRDFRSGVVVGLDGRVVIRGQSGRRVSGTEAGTVCDPRGESREEG